MTQLINLNATDLLTEGGRRLIYVNPEDNTKLIKIVKQQDLDRKRAKLDFFKKFRTDDMINENIEDFNAYKIYNKKSKQIFDFIPKLYGFVKTNYGLGLMTEFIKNFNGTPSPSLQTYIKIFGFTDQIKNALQKLYNQLITHNLITRELKSFNLVVKFILKNEFTLYIIDGFGNPELIPISNYIKFLGNRKINKHFNIFMKTIETVKP